MPEPRRVLMVHYYYPPLGGIGSVRAVKFARHLPRWGWSPTVLAPRCGFYHEDPSLDDASIDVQRTFSLELSRGVRRGLAGRDGHDLRPFRPRGVAALLQRLARRWVYRPDGQVGWYPFALQVGRRLLRERRFDAVFSSSFPITAHLIARRLSVDHNLPWVADYRDPWTDVAVYDSRWRRVLDRRLEAWLLSEAQAVITVSAGFARLLEARGAARVEVIPNGFDPEDYPSPQPPEDVIAYLGTYYPSLQDLDTALQALGRLAESGALGATRLRFVGEYGPELLSSLERFGLAGRSERTGFLPHRTALGQIARARVLLLAGLREQARDDPLAGWVPGKVFEYLGTCRPILYVGNEDGEVADLLRREAGTSIVASGQVTNAATALTRLLHSSEEARGRDLSRFTRQQRAAELAQVLDDVVRAAPPRRGAPP